MRFIKQKIKKLINKLNYDLVYYEKEAYKNHLIVNNINFVIDIGANIGQYRDEIRKYGYQGDILSIEPQSSAYKILLKNSSYDKKWMVYKQCGLGDKNEKKEIFISKNSVSSSFLEMKNNHIDSAPNSISIDSEIVEIETLDSVYKNSINNQRVFIKIDSQGYEMNIIRGGEFALRHASGLQVEVSCAELYHDQSNLEDLMDKISSLGFKIWDIVPGFRNLNDGRLLQFDLICYK